MGGEELKGQNHRSFITLLMGLAGLALFLELVLWFGPIAEAKRDLDERQQRVDRSQQLLGTRDHYRSMLDKVSERRSLLRDTEKRWTGWVDTLGGQPSRFSGNTAEELRIDYKVALFNVRARLYREASEAGVKIPKQLGLPETLGAEEDALVRLWELETVAKLTRALIRNKVTEISSIQSLPVELRRPELDGAPPMYEFPVVVDFRSDYQKLGELKKKMQEQGSFFTLRNVWVEKVLPQEPGDKLLDVSLVVSIPFFQELQGLEGLEEESSESVFEVIHREEEGP